ncbi:serine/threonine-protein kinase fray2 isoform X1 [Iris pallida]|uniref:Serine/threonine-protein kinase fray2 isoform X1 n=1 Tax=Iris pallida TaxID=29817 RepID=A0AAX6F1N3_IRIPA|nr:serine/threonine-protein kinase fray2 isoform X1 [Iris pallida]
MDHKFERRFPANPKDYKLYEEVGEGVTATVYRALCVPLNEIVAIKVIDLEKCNNDLDGIRREVQTMSLINHPNLLRAHCSFVADHCLWVVMPYMAGGSCLHIMKSAFPEGFEEAVIATLLREVLKALVYLHGHGHIHRDVKAGNILIDANGAVKLADFGVSACLFDTGDRQRSRSTFVGTPCWMAPEVMQQLHGYDFKADIWSFGITALELAHGHAPFSKYPPMKVLLMTLQNAPPGLDYERDKRFSKSFKELVSACLVKDPKKRPTSEKLLKHSFFKHARSNDYLVRTILYDLSPLGDRFRTLKAKEATLLQDNHLKGDEQLSQQTYIRGISAWNFNLEELKKQAALIQSSDGSFSLENLDNNRTLQDNSGIVDSEPQSLSTERVFLVIQDGLQDFQDFESPFASSFPIRPLEALRTCFDVCEEDTSTRYHREDLGESRFPSEQPSRVDELDSRKYNRGLTERRSSVPNNMNAVGSKKFSSGSLVPDHVLSPYKQTTGDAERDDIHLRLPQERNSSGPIFHRQVRDTQNSIAATVTEEPSEGRIIQRKGRFKVTSADSGPKVAPTGNCIANPVCGSASLSKGTSPILLSLQLLLQQNSMQREELTNAIKRVEQISGRQAEPSDVGNTDLSQFPPSSSRERELQAYLTKLQHSTMSLAEELQTLKFKNYQLERKIDATLAKERKSKDGEGSGHVTRYGK